MARPVTLFTGRWADMPLEVLAEKAANWGYDGLELACWGDHFEVDKALADDNYRELKRKMLKKHGLEVHEFLKYGYSLEQTTPRMMIREGPKRYKRWHSSDRGSRKHLQGRKFVWKRTRVKIDEFFVPSWVSDWFQKLRIWKWFSPKR